MTELLVSLFMSLCSLQGILLRNVPFRKVIGKEQRKTLVAANAALILSNIVVVCFLFKWVGFSSTFLKADLFVVAIVSTLIHVLVIRGRIREHLFVFGIVQICNTTIVAIPTLFTSVLVGLDGTLAYIVGVSAYVLVLAASYFPCRKLLRDTVEPFLTIENGKYWNSIWFIPFAMYLATVFGFPEHVHSETLGHFAGRVFICVATLLMCKSIAEDHKRMREKQAMVELLSDQRVYYAQMQQQVDDARRTRHDFKHHVAAIMQYVDTNDREGLRQYCAELMERNEEVRVPYTGNAAADGVLYRYSQLAREQRIDLRCSGRLKTEGIADVDICVLLGNALDNALTGCLTASGDRHITVLARTEEQMLSVIVQNTFDGVVCRKEGVMLSRKRENAPGVGLRSMQSVCDRYGGSLDVRWTEDTFTVMFMLPLACNGTPEEETAKA